MDNLCRVCALLPLLIAVVLPTTEAFAQDAVDSGQARIDAARSLYESASAEIEVGQGDPETVYQWSVRWLVAERERHPERTREALEQHRSRMLSLRVSVRKMAEAGLVAVSSSVATDYYVHEAEFWLQRQ